MRWRSSIRVVLLAAATLVGVSLGVGQDQNPANVKVELLSELHQLRKAVGSSVLSGTMLEAAPEQVDADFDAGLRQVLGLEAPAPGGEARPFASSMKPSSPKLTSVQIVLMLRKHSAALDGISHEIEQLRRYENADQLRQTATELRLLARQLDAEVDRSLSASEK